MKSKLLVTGSLAFDRIAVFRDQFSKHILKGHVHNLNVSFTVEDMAVNYGGTGGNIAYNLGILGQSPLLLAAAGSDAGHYLKHLKAAKVDTSKVKKFPKLLSSSAIIMTDLDDNQIASFYVGAMKNAHQLKMNQIKEKLDMAIIAPNDKKAMIAYGDYCFKKEIPFIADPGQSIPVFNKVELQEFLMGAHALVTNDYEWQMIKDKTGWSLKNILQNVNYLIVTYGDQGSEILCPDAAVIRIPTYKAKRLVDPTGCGDAYRAGLMYGYANNYNIEKSAHIGAWLAAKVAEVKGTQNHKVSKTDFNKFLKKL